LLCAEKRVVAELMTEWKNGVHTMGSKVPAFKVQLSEDEKAALQAERPQLPSLKLMELNNNQPSIPMKVKERWASDPIRGAHWTEMLKKIEGRLSAPPPPAPSDAVTSGANPVGDKEEKSQPEAEGQPQEHQTS